MIVEALNTSITNHKDELYRLARMASHSKHDPELRMLADRILESIYNELVPEHS